MLSKSAPLLLALAGLGLAGTYQSALDILPYAAKTGAKVYYASTTGTSSAAGILAAPYDLETGMGKLTAGDTLYVRGGTYARTTTLTVGTSNGNATSGHTHVFAYKSEKPVFDFTGMAVADANRGLQINGSYWYFKGFEVINAGDNGVFVAGNYNVIESFSIHGNWDSGLQISRNSSSQATIDQWPKFNLIKNSDSYNNSDVLGENADGFAAKLTIGEGNAFTNCVSHHNSDDGWDLYTKTATGAIGTVTIDRCVAHHNGTLLNGTMNVNGDRNGFKLGGSKMANRHIVTRSVSFANGHNGFTWNSNPGQIVLANNLAIDNAEGNYKFGDGSTNTAAEFYNNISVWTSLSADVSDNTYSTNADNMSNVWWNSSKAAGATSINAKGLKGYIDDFATSPATITGVSRLVDGSIDFSVFALASSSDLINAGITPSTLVPTAVTSSYVGVPDLGPVEYGATSSSSSSVASSSSVGAVAIVKHGTGGSSQAVTSGDSIVSFWFSWENATGISVTGVPAGLTVVVDNAAASVTFSGVITTVDGTYTYTLTTVGGAATATKSGAFTVTSGKSSSAASGIIVSHRVQMLQATGEVSFFSLNGARLASRPTGMTYLERNALGEIHIRKSLR